MKDRLEVTGLSLDLKSIIKKCLRNMAASEKTTGDESTVDDETELVGGEGSDHDEEERPPKRARKRDRCGECKREKDLKVRTHCGATLLCVRCIASCRANLARRIKGLTQRFF